MTRKALVAQRIEEIKRNIGVGGAQVATIRALLYIRMAEGAADERSFAALQTDAGRSGKRDESSRRSRSFFASSSSCSLSTSAARSRPYLICSERNRSLRLHSPRSCDRLPKWRGFTPRRRSPALLKSKRFSASRREPAGRQGTMSRRYTQLPLDMVGAADGRCDAIRRDDMSREFCEME